MLFPSNQFLLAFLPATLIVFLCLRRWAGDRAVVYFLLLASLVFYSWNYPIYLPLILFSMVFNYFVAQACATNRLGSRSAIAIGVTIDLLILGWFKYSGFFSSSLAAVLGAHLAAYQGPLPLAISFFTFLQIAYLVDVCTERRHPGGMADYFLFVTFFPHLIAGPIVHHSELIPQFSTFGRGWRRWQIGFAVGITIFAIGLFKKICIADNVAPYADLIFDGANAGQEPSLIPAWTGTLAYALQIYFDFSGYSDMAIGLSKMFCLKLPINFNSPYQASSIIDFWKRWHITLSRFLRDYLYIPLGGGRCGTPRRLANLMTVMLLGGLWHGAGWKFVVWGGLHGLYLVINQLWRLVAPNGLGRSSAWTAASWLLTFCAVLAAWVPFRATDLETAERVWRGLAGLNGVTVIHSLAFIAYYLPFIHVGAWGLLDIGETNLAFFALGLFIALLCPNVYQIVRRGSPVLQTGVALGRPFGIQWRPALVYAFALSALLIYSFASNQVASPFLYFQF